MAYIVWAYSYQRLHSCIHTQICNKYKADSGFSRGIYFYHHHIRKSWHILCFPNSCNKIMWLDFLRFPQHWFHPATLRHYYYYGSRSSGGRHISWIHKPMYFVIRRKHESTCLYFLHDASIFFPLRTTFFMAAVVVVVVVVVVNVDFFVLFFSSHDRVCTFNMTFFRNKMIKIYIIKILEREWQQHFFHFLRGTTTLRHCRRRWRPRCISLSHASYIMVARLPPVFILYVYL